MRSVAFAVAAVVALAPLAWGHDFNHQDRHEACQVYGDPDLDAVGDGHVHTHDDAAAAAMGLHNHDPCKQVGMLFPSFADSPALREIDLALALTGDGDPATTEFVTGAGEAFQVDYPTADLKEQTDLLLVGDAAAATLGLPGSGTPADPYLVEGYVIANLLELRDTSKCYVVRNNIVNAPLLSPLIDAADAVVLETLRPTYEAMRDEALAAVDAVEAELAAWDATAAAWEAHVAEVEAAEAAAIEALAVFDAAFDTFEAAYVAAVGEATAAATSFEDYSASYAPMSAPPPPHLPPSLMAPIPSVDGYVATVAAWIEGTPPPAEAPDGSWSAAEWEEFRDAYLMQVQDAGAAAASHLAAVGLAPDLAAYEAALADATAASAASDTASAEHEAFLADMAAGLAEAAGVTEASEAALAEVAEFEAKASEAEIEFAGPVAYLAGEVHLLVDSWSELAHEVLALLLPHVPEVKGPRMALDWNGQCLHVHHNVVGDLRVNQNNDRTGWATGGLVEDNRFYTIGQIRHYDGEFRENEVGDRDHLRSLTDDGVMAPPGDRSINNDGANQGWMHHNTIYGQVDLDFHGHHHAPGFFAPESHYHGSDAKVAYMLKPDGTFKLDAAGNKVPHHDHAKRWTSVRFEDNIVIDPKGVGLRFEDEQHRQDDEKANSENMVELKRPHFHQSEVELARNLVVGPIGIDTFNAEGTWLWNDDWSPVKADLAGRVLDAVAHLGADIVNSHPQRNPGWIDLEGNTQYLVGGGTGIRILHAKQADEVELRDNRQYVLGAGFDSGGSASDLLDTLKASHGRPASSVWPVVSAWGGTVGDATAIQVADARDVKVTLCGNQARGHARSVVATDRVYTDTAFTSACDSDWGDAAAPAYVATPYPPAPPKCTQGLRDTTDPTQAKYVLHPGYDVVDGVLGQVCALLPGELTTTSAPLPAPIASSTPTLAPVKAPAGLKVK